MKKIALLVLAAPLVLAACAGSSKALKVDPVAYVKRAAHKTAAMPSEHMTMTGSVVMGPVTLKMTGSGDFANATKQGQMTATVDVLGQKVQVDEVLDGTTIYMRSPMFGGPSGKPWTKFDLQKLAASQATHTKLLTSLTSQNPAQALQQLMAAGSVKTIGTETIDGVETTHYQVTNLDVTKLPHGAKIQALAHPKYGPIDVWIGNDNGYVYRETLSSTYSAAGQSASISMRVDLSKFGEKVSVTVPSASETYDASTEFQGMGA